MGVEIDEEVLKSLSSEGYQGEEDYSIHLGSNFENLPAYTRFYSESDADIFVAEEDGELLGAAVYNNRGGMGVLEHVEVFEEERGRGVGSALVDRMLEEADADSLYAQATSMDGKSQTMLENRGFESSGFRIGAEISDIDEDTIEGFNLDIWRTEDSVKAYIPSDLQRFADKALEDQRNVEYLEPDNNSLTGSFEFTDRRGRRLEMIVGEGDTIWPNVERAMNVVDNDEYFATTVHIDVSEPVAYPILEELNDRGFRPINFSPAVDGRELTMLGLRIKSGELALTDENSELLEATGLEYEVIPQPDRPLDRYSINPSL